MFPSQACTSVSEAHGLLQAQGLAPFWCCWRGSSVPPQSGLGSGNIPRRRVAVGQVSASELIAQRTMRRNKQNSRPTATESAGGPREGGLMGLFAEAKATVLRSPPRLPSARWRMALRGGPSNGGKGRLSPAPPLAVDTKGHRHHRRPEGG